MAYKGSFECAGLIFDIFDTERVPVGLTSNKYYITPMLATRVEIWLIKNNINKVENKDHMATLISQGLLGVY